MRSRPAYRGAVTPPGLDNRLVAGRSSPSGHKSVSLVAERRRRQRLPPAAQAGVPTAGIARGWRPPGRARARAPRFWSHESPSRAWSELAVSAEYSSVGGRNFNDGLARQDFGASDMASPATSRPLAASWYIAGRQVISLGYTEFPSW